jgi:AcrR family transcriptional regulator
MVQAAQLETSRPRLGRAEWIREGLRVLADAGIEAVRVEPLATRLSVSKGSFYWHFEDRDELLVAMLDAWRQRATQSVIQLVDSLSEEPDRRLRDLVGLVARRPEDREFWFEIGFRDWARRDRRARVAVESVDAERVGYIHRLLLDLGLSEEDAEARAFLIYSYILGEGVVSRTATRFGRADRVERCVEQLLSNLPKKARKVPR